MNNHAIRTPRLTDGQIIDLLIAIRREALGFASAAIGFGSGIGQGINSDTDDAQLEQYKGNSHAILSLDVNLGQNNVDIRFRRGTCPDSDQPDLNRQASPYHDEVFVCPDRNHPTSPDVIIECLDVIEKTLPGVPRAFEENGHAVVDVLRVEMSSLNETYRNMLKDFADERNEFLKGFEEQRRSVEEERQTAKANLDTEAEQHRLEFQQYMKDEEAKLSQRRTELDAKEQELDNRQHMHVRRELRKQIIEEFERRGDAPVVSKSARRIRWGVFGMSFVAGAGLFVFGLWTFYLLLDSDQFLPNPRRLDFMPEESISSLLSLLTSKYWLLAARAAVSSLAGGGLFFYAIRWLRSIYLEDVRTIRHYDSYRDDIDRASFAIETIMEISSEKEGVTVPEAWIEGVCRNLFRSDVGDKAEGGQQTAALIELLRSISSASVGPNGAEVTLDRKGGRRLAKKMSADNG